VGASNGQGCGRGARGAAISAAGSFVGGDSFIGQVVGGAAAGCLNGRLSGSGCGRGARESVASFIGSKAGNSFGENTIGTYIRNAEAAAVARIASEGSPQHDVSDVDDKYPASDLEDFKYLVANKQGKNNIVILRNHNPNGPWKDLLVIYNAENSEVLATYEANLNPRIQRGATDYANCDDCGIISNGTYQIRAQAQANSGWYPRPLLYVNGGDMVDSLVPNSGQGGANRMNLITIHGRDSPSQGCIMVNAEGTAWRQFMSHFKIGTSSGLFIYGPTKYKGLEDFIECGAAN
jgi:hypothetical protein